MWQRLLFVFGPALLVACGTDACTTSNDNPQLVQEVEPGTYKIGIARSSATLFSTTDKNGIGVAVDKAGEFCHSKGQKLLVKQTVGSSIIFSCVADDAKPH